MAAHWIFINSSAYRRFIERSRENHWVFWGATAGLVAAAYGATQVVMGLTNPDMEQEGARDRSEDLAKLPMHAQAVARSNREQLRAMLQDVAAGKDQARYKSMLDGKIHGTTHGTSMPPGEGGTRW